MPTPLHQNVMHSIVKSANFKLNPYFRIIQCTSLICTYNMLYRVQSVNTCLIPNVAIYLHSSFPWFPCEMDSVRAHKGHGSGGHKHNCVLFAAAWNVIWFGRVLAWLSPGRHIPCMVEFAKHLLPTSILYNMSVWKRVQGTGREREKHTGRKSRLMICVLRIIYFCSFIIFYFIFHFIF